MVANQFRLRYAVHDMLQQGASNKVQTTKRRRDDGHFKIRSGFLLKSVTSFFYSYIYEVGIPFVALLPRSVVSCLNLKPAVKGGAQSSCALCEVRVLYTSYNDPLVADYLMRNGKGSDWSDSDIAHPR